MVFSRAEVRLMDEREQKNAEMAPFNSNDGEGREDYLIQLCMVVDWCIDHPEYTIKVIPKKDYPVLMPCEF